MFSTLKIKFSFSKIFVSVFCAVLFFAVLPAVVKAQIVNRSNVTGWAWASNIGWIRFDTGKDKSVTYDRNTGYFYGYAWSNNIGWVKFDGLSTSGGGVGGNSAKANISTGLISDWARACAGTADGKCFSMTSRNDGWDGWIRFDTGRSNSARIDFATGDFHGYAWGSDVVGWISFNCREGGSVANNICSSSLDYKVTIGSIDDSRLNVTINTPNCGTGTVVSNDPPPLNIDCPNNSCSALYNQNDKVTITATPTNGSTFEGWGGDVGAICGKHNSCTATMPNVDINAVATFSKVCGSSSSSSSSFISEPESSSSSSSSSLSSSSSSESGSSSSGGGGGPGPTLTLTVGCGTVTVLEDGFTCNNLTCSTPYISGTSLTLNAENTNGSVFSHWGGACSGLSCSLTMDGSKSVQAIFNPNICAVSSSSSSIGGGGGSGSSSVSSAKANVIIQEI